MLVTNDNLLHLWTRNFIRT